MEHVRVPLRSRPLTLLACTALAVFSSCSSDSHPPASERPPIVPTDAHREKTVYLDQYSCRQPPTIADCDAPPNKASTSRYYCWGCNCAGPNPVAGCNPMTNDCRYFADGCIPRSYSLCDPQASDLVLALCGHCFFQEAGYPADCDQLKGGSGGPRDLGASLF